MNTVEDRRLFRFQGEVWLHPGAGGWHFVTLSHSLSKRIKAFVAADAAAWGSVKVSVRIDATEWSTSIFPDRKRGAYLLPIKGGVRKERGIEAGSFVRGAIIVHCKRLAPWD